MLRPEFSNANPATFLAFFRPGLTWRAILDITAGHCQEWWRNAVVQAEDDELLEWVRETKEWRLSEKGVDFVYANTRGRA